MAQATTQADFERADQIGAILAAAGIDAPAFEMDGSTVIYRMATLATARQARDLVARRGYRKAVAKNLYGEPSLIVRR